MDAFRARIAGSLGVLAAGAGLLIALSSPAASSTGAQQRALEASTPRAPAPVFVATHPVGRLDALNSSGAAVVVDVNCVHPSGQRSSRTAVRLQPPGTTTRIDGLIAGSLCTVTPTTLPAGVQATPATGLKVLTGKTADLTLSGTGRVQVELKRSGGTTNSPVRLTYTCDGGATGSGALRGGQRLELSTLAGANCTIAVQDPLYQDAGTTGHVVTAELGRTTQLSIEVTRRTAPVTFTATARGADPTVYVALDCSGQDEEKFTLADLPLEETAGGSGSTTGTGELRARTYSANAAVPTGLSCGVRASTDDHGVVIEPVSSTLVTPSDGKPVASKLAATGTGTLKITAAAPGAPAGATFPVSYSCTDGTTGRFDLAAGATRSVEKILGGARCTTTGSATFYDATTPAPLEVNAGATREATLSFTRRYAPLTLQAKATGGTPLASADLNCTDTATPPAPPLELRGRQIAVSAKGIGTDTLELMPDGYTCEITTRSLSDGFVVSPESATALAGSTATFNLTGVGTFQVSLAQYGGPRTAALPVNYECIDDASGKKISGVLSVTVQQPGQVKKVLGGSHCTVRATSSHYDLTVPTTPTRVGPGLISSTTITAIRQTTNLTLSTSASGGGGTFIYSVHCTGKDGETFDLPQVSLMAGEFSGPDTREIPGVPTDLSCLVKPAKLPKGFAADVPSRTVTAGGKVVFATLGTGDLTVKTTVAGAPAKATFDITYSCSDGTKKTYTVGVAGDNRTIKALKGGTFCEIKTESRGYRVKITKAPWTVVPGETNAVTVDLVRERADVTIEATTDGVDGTFHYAVNCADEDEQVKTTAVLATVDGDGLTIIPQVPTGLDCQIVEQGQEQWQIANLTQTSTPGQTVTFVHRHKEPVTVIAFYDKNLNGAQDAGEPPLPGWQVSFAGRTVATGPKGTVTASVVPDAPRSGGAAANWLRTTPDPDAGTAPREWKFALVCVGGPGWNATLHDPAWWADQGRGLITAQDLAALRAVALVDAQGIGVDPEDVDQLSRWLTAPTGQNTAARLSRQVAAGVLSLRHTPTLGSTMVLAPQPGDEPDSANVFEPLSQLVTQARQSLAVDGYTPPADPNRLIQDRLDYAITSANSGMSAVNTTPCSTPTTFTF